MDDYIESLIGDPYVVRILADDPAGVGERKIWIAYSDMTYEIIKITIPAYRTDEVHYYDNGGFASSKTTGFRKGMALSRMSKYRMTKPEAHSYIAKQTIKWLKSCKESHEKFGNRAYWSEQYDNMLEEK